MSRETMAALEFRSGTFESRASGDGQCGQHWRYLVRVAYRMIFIQRGRDTAITLQHCTLYRVP